MSRKVRRRFRKLIILIIIVLALVLSATPIKTKLTRRIYRKEYTEYVVKYSEQYGVEENLIYALKKAESNSIDKFKQYVKENMEKLGIQKLETEIGKMSITKNPLSVEIQNEDEIPAEFKQEVVTTKIDKTAIKNYFKETGRRITF